MPETSLISIGKLSERTGVAVSAIRFYEDKGLIRSIRNRGGHRRFLRADVRRLSFILIAQQLGFSLADIADQLASLPQGRNPTKRDWTRISRQFGAVLDARIAALTNLRTRLDGCIGCGCLSLKACALYNREDQAAANGPGPRYLLGDAVTLSPVAERPKDTP
ncbi:MAG: redox-sensitive transcriptional activator SoxR [Pseudomonadota bacterium]